jgi:hypothetical protein
MKTQKYPSSVTKKATGDQAHFLWDRSEKWEVISNSLCFIFEKCDSIHTNSKNLPVSLMLIIFLCYKA